MEALLRTIRPTVKEGGPEMARAKPKEESLFRGRWRIVSVDRSIPRKATKQMRRGLLDGRVMA
jgi:hypothetical protein